MRTIAFFKINFKYVLMVGSFVNQVFSFPRASVARVTCKLCGKLVIRKSSSFYGHGKKTYASR